MFDVSKQRPALTTGPENVALYGRLLNALLPATTIQRCKLLVPVLSLLLLILVLVARVHLDIRVSTTHGCCTGYGSVDMVVASASYLAYTLHVKALAQLATLHACAFPSSASSKRIRRLIINRSSALVKAVQLHRGLNS